MTDDQALALVKQPGDTVVRLDKVPAAHRMHYTHGLEVIDQDGRSAGLILWSMRLGIKVEVKGARTPAFAEALQGVTIPYQVTRIDSCLDFDFPGSYEALKDIVAAPYAGKGKRPRETIDRSSTETVTYGSKTSPTKVRIYPKGKTKDCSALNRPNWSRVEIEYRPATKAEKQIARLLTPHTVWGSAGWSAELYGRLLGAAAPTRITAPAPAPTATLWEKVGRQYGKQIDKAMKADGLTADDVVALILGHIRR